MSKSVKVNLPIHARRAATSLVAKWNEDCGGDLLDVYDDEVFPGPEEKALAYLDDCFIVVMSQPTVGMFLEATTGIDCHVLILYGEMVRIQVWHDGDYQTFLHIPGYIRPLSDVEV